MNKKTTYQHIPHTQYSHQFKKETVALAKKIGNISAAARQQGMPNPYPGSDSMHTMRYG